MSEFNPFNRFPDMRPVQSVPPLFTFNGCGLGVYGARDYDPDTGSYVKTLCICLLFIPVFALSAYRVCDADRGWYFLGKVRLSWFARGWNLCLVGAAVLFISLTVWHQHTESPDYQAGKKLAEADRLAQAGEIGRAAGLYRDVARGVSSHSSEAVQRLRELVEGPATDAAPAEAAEVFRAAADLHHKPGHIPDLAERGLQLANHHADADPRGALLLADAVAPVAEAKQVDALRQRVLEALVQREPNDPEPAVRLAVICEAQGQLPRCEKLLLPHRDRLGSGEGARILGQVLAHQGKFEEARALLLPYTEQRLQRLHTAEKRLDEVYEATRKRLVEQIETNHAPDFPYERFKTATQAEQGRIVREYVLPRLKDDPGLKSAQEQVAKEADVVPVALDLGIVLLRRGQAAANPAVRRRELEQAEKVFLAVRGVAGESDQYRLFFGQVCYWLGKHDEGRKQFDGLLEAQKRSPEILVAVARLLREVGDVSRARSLAEEAYGKEDDKAIKEDIAHFRALVFRDLDDEILWLGRCNASSLEVKASLSTVRGQQALLAGKDDEAAKHLREAIAVYEQMPPGPAPLNNSALAHFALYRATGDRSALDKGVEMLEKAVALKGSDSILLVNVATTRRDLAFQDVAGAAIDFRALKRGGSLEVLSFLYQDQAGRDALVKRVREHPGVARARAHFEKLLVLSPKGTEAYSALAALHAWTRNADELRALLRRLDGVELDLSDASRQHLDFCSGKEDAKFLKELDEAQERAGDSLKAGRKAGGATFALAVETVVKLRISALMMGRPVDTDALVALAEEAHRTAPSRGTHNTLEAALLARAHLALAKAAQEYAALAAKGQRSLGPSYLVAVALTHEGKARDACLANDDVRRAVALRKESVQNFPDDSGEWSWAVLRAAEPAMADRLAEVLRGNEVARLERELDQRLSPYSAADAYKVYWAALAAGKEPEGRAALKRCADLGTPLPLPMK